MSYNVDWRAVKLNRLQAEKDAKSALGWWKRCTRDLWNVYNLMDARRVDFSYGGQDWKVSFLPYRDKHPNLYLGAWLYVGLVDGGAPVPRYMSRVLSVLPSVIHGVRPVRSEVKVEPTYMSVALDGLNPFHFITDNMSVVKWGYNE